MTLRDSEILALAIPPSTTRPGSAALAAPVRRRADFARRVLRLREGSVLLVLGDSAAAEAEILSKTIKQMIRVRVTAPSTGGQAGALRASQRSLPFADASFDAAAELGAGRALLAETDVEARELLAEVARVLRPGGRYLCNGIANVSPAGVSPDKRRVDNWRWEGGSLLHHEAQLARSDGSWRRLHERLRVRGFEQAASLLNGSGFAVLNAFTGYGQQHQAAEPAKSTGLLLLCERAHV